MPNRPLAVTCAGVVVLLSACLALSGCFKPDYSANFDCGTGPLGPVAIPPSTNYAAHSADELEVMAHGGLMQGADLGAARVLGERYAVGEALPVDRAKALEWFEAAAIVPPATEAVYMPGYGKTPGSTIVITVGGSRPGDPIAMRYLGEAYMNGAGVKKDENWGRTLLACAARFGVMAP